MHQKSRCDERLFLFRRPHGDHSMPIRAVILDLDGTLVDTAEEIALALNETLAGLGLPGVSLEAATARIGRGGRALVEGAAAEGGGPGDLDRPAATFSSPAARLTLL